MLHHMRDLSPLRRSLTARLAHGHCPCAAVIPALACRHRLACRARSGLAGPRAGNRPLDRSGGIRPVAAHGDAGKTGRQAPVVHGTDLVGAAVHGLAFIVAGVDTAARGFSIGNLVCAMDLAPSSATAIPTDHHRRRFARPALLVTVLGFWNARRTAAVVQVDVPIANLPEALTRVYRSADQRHPRAPPSRPSTCSASSTASTA